MSNQHYPYSSRNHGLRWPISGTEVDFPSYNRIKLYPTLSITKLSDLISSSIAPTIPVGDRPDEIAFDYIPKVTSLSGWTINTIPMQIYLQHFVRTDSFPSFLVPNNRIERRINKHHFAIGASIVAITDGRLGSVNICRFTLRGYWGINAPLGIGPALIDYTETCPLPTLFSCCQDTKRIDSVTYPGSSFTVTENTILKIGTVPTVIEDHITDLRDEVLGVCQTTDVSAEFWLAALPAALPRDLHNRSLANSSYFIPLSY